MRRCTGGLQPADPRRRRRRGPRAARAATGARSPLAEQAPSAIQQDCDSPEGAHGRQDSRERSSTSTACSSTRPTSGLAGVAARADGDRTGPTSADQTTWSPERFTPQVYQQVMSGKPRMSGARAALEYFGVPDADERVADVRRAQADDGRSSSSRPASSRPTRTRCGSSSLSRTPGSGWPRRRRRRTPGCSCARSASTRSPQEQGSPRRSCRPGLTPARLLRRRHLGPGLRARKAPPRDVPDRRRTSSASPRSDCFVIEDAAAGVQAAKAGGMAALGVARADDAELLAEADADLVVTTLDDVDLDALADGRLAGKEAKLSAYHAKASAPCDGVGSEGGDSVQRCDHSHRDDHQAQQGDRPAERVALARAGGLRYRLTGVRRRPRHRLIWAGPPRRWRRPTLHRCVGARRRPPASPVQGRRPTDIARPDPWP